MAKVLIFGSFDLIHPGHLFLINEAQKYGEVNAVVGLDETIEKVKGRRPYYPLVKRLQHLRECGVRAHAGDPQDKLRTFKELAPEYIILGYDQRAFVDQLREYIQQYALTTKIVEAPAFHPELFKSKKIRKALEDPQAGFLLIDKPSGEPSLATVTALRKITGIKQIGFAGTLDPVASGLLICGMSAATTLLDWFHLLPKTYEAEASLGSTSDTYDRTGIVQKKSDLNPTHEQLAGVLNDFRGTSMQEPPMFSAKKIKGKRLYEIARAGETVERKKQQITVHAIELLSYTYPLVRLRIQSSSGTYIRSLVHDMGQALGTGAVMTELRRTAIGEYSVTKARPVVELDATSWRRKMVSIKEALVMATNAFFPEI